MSVRWPRRTILPKPRPDTSAVDPAAPRIGVVIPTYNRATLLPRAMRSVLAQTFADLELIVVDDASADGSADVAERCEDPRVRVTRLATNGGVSHALNQGIAATRGEFVTFLGDDDEWLPELMERLVARLDGDGGSVFSVAYSDARVVPASEDGDRPHLPEGDILNDLLLGTIQIFASACLVRRSALLEFGGYDETFRQGGDRDLWMRMAAASHRFAAVREPLAVVHREHGLGHILGDPVVRAVAAERHHRRWGRLARQRMGDEYTRRRRWQSQRKRREQRKIVKRLVRAGSRTEAWRYARRMAPTLPWGTPYVAQALSVAALGPWPYRLRRAAKALRKRSAGE